MEATPERMTREDLHYAINHVFLPPRLPHKDDFSGSHVQAFINLVTSTLHEFADRTTGDPKPAVDQALSLITSFGEVHEVGEDGINIVPKELEKKLRQLCEAGGSILLHVYAQNCGILVNRVGDALHFEILELTPSNKAIHEAQGRLIRVFPGHAIAVAVATLLQADHISSLSTTLGTLSHQEPSFRQPMSQKASSSHNEIRESANPIMVTEHLSGLLLALGSPIEVLSIKKNTRDEALWKDCLIPWTRSPTWLLFRVAMQLTMHRQQHNEHEDKYFDGLCAYKEYMAFFLADLLSKACSQNIASDLLSVMTSKLSYRLRKMGEPSGGWLTQHAQAVVKHTNSLLNRRWNQICASTSPIPDMVNLPELDHEQDTFASIIKLDEHLEYLAQLSASHHVAEVRPKNVLEMHNPKSLPHINHTIGDYTTMHLAAVEDWVEAHLDTWLQKNISKPSTCDFLSKLIRNYHKVAASFYESNPEAISIMVLICMELWIACNKSAHHLCPLLQDYHESTVPENLVRGLLQSLILPCHSQLQKLDQVDKYLALCSQKSCSTLPSIFTDFGHKTSFYVRYFDSSTEQQNLHRTIEQSAALVRSQKREEFEKKRAEHANLRAEYGRLSCRYGTYEDRWGRTRTRHEHWVCRKCDVKKQYESMSIGVHEWPLPKALCEAKNAVFELNSPEWFTCWRDITAFLLLKVLSLDYSAKILPRQQHHLHQYPGLICYRSATQDQRFYAVSQTKSFLVAHYATKKIGAIIDESMILVDHALHYQYYDAQKSQSTAGFMLTTKLPRQCMFKVPQNASALQEFLFRPSTNPDGPSPNTVIASQHACPQGMTLPQYRELCSIPLGHLLQWKNILRQLHAPTVDFNDPTTSAFLLQCATQTGPPAKQTSLRACHAVLRDTRFTNEVLSGLEKTSSRLSESWKSNEAFRAFIMLATRVLSLTEDIATINRCLKFLESARKTVLSWAIALREKARASQSSEARTRFRTRAARCALICALSFDVDTCHIETVMGSVDAKTDLLQCALIVHGGIGAQHNANDLSHWKWQRLCLQFLPTLVKSLTNGCAAADDAIKQSWPKHGVQSSWRSLSQANSEWLVGQGSSENLYQVHFNILTGELLVNGLPLNRLPNDYEGTETYKLLFGESILDVMPGNVAGFAFATNVPFADHHVNFALGPLPHELNIRAERDGKVTKFLPRRLLAGVYPEHFVNGFVHWYHEETDVVEFRPISTPWETDSQHWKLVRASESDPWQLVKDDILVCTVESHTSVTLAKILNPIEVRSRIHCLYSHRQCHLDVDLPNLQTRFYLDKGDQTLSCRDFRGMVVDSDQKIGTLIGLENKLVLRSNKDARERLVLIPHGSPTSTQTSGHVLVNVAKPQQGFVHAFRLDFLLGRLVDGGDLLSKAFLCLLHALTSFCLPDPHTLRTGTEEALRILRSAAMRSFSTLDEESIGILRVIAAITPKRCFYPDHLEVMQTVAWRNSLGFLAQHDDLVTAVDVILRQAEENKFFHESHADIEPESIWIGQKKHLMIRNRIRHSQTRVDAFGAEHHQAAREIDYRPRDSGAHSDVSTKTYCLAKNISTRVVSSYCNIAGNLHEHVWGFLRSSRVVNVCDRFSPEKITFGSEWLLPWNQSSKEFLTTNWLNLHDLLASPNMQHSTFTVMAWLSAIECAGKSDSTVVHIVASFFTAAAQMRRIKCPVSSADFDLGQGFNFVDEQIRSSIKSERKHFDPDRDIIEARNDDETIQEYHHRGQLSWEARAANAADELVGHLKRQWPCRVPSIPARPAAGTYFYLEVARAPISSLFRVWHENLQFRNYLKEVCNVVSAQVKTFQPPSFPSLSAHQTKNKSRGSVSVSGLFSSPAPARPASQVASISHLLAPGSPARSNNSKAASEKLAGLIESSSDRAKSIYEKEYVADLQASQHALEQHKNYSKQLAVEPEAVVSDLKLHLEQCERNVAAIYQSITNAITQGAFDIYQWPRLSPILLLEQLNRDNWQKLDPTWKSTLTEYALALTRLQRAKRLAYASGADLIKELNNPGHTNWTPGEHPEWLLLEIEGSILIREVQVQIATRMHAPTDGQNSVMQLNMGEGKSSVIVPILVISLADGDKLMRVLVAKPQSKQMVHMLTSKLGGLINRQVFHLPFSRAVPVGSDELTAIEKLHTRCQAEGGVLLVQPEHILSLQLMGIEKKISGASTTADKILELHEFMRRHSRDVVDESDENFSPKFELVYSLGTQQPVDHSPERWTVIQEVLEVIRKCLPDIVSAFPRGTDIKNGSKGSFPRTRIIDTKAADALLDLLTDKFCLHGLKGFPITQSSDNVRDAVRKYIRDSRPDSGIKALVEKSSPAGFWTEVTKNTLMLLRGLIGCGILSFTLGQKRWRVDYGLDTTRSPPTNLAVPYRAKDHPSARSEFSHPDVVIVLTCLSYYYQGLTNDQLAITFAHLDLCDQRDDEYAAWVKDANELPLALQHLSGVNLEDPDLCADKLFPCFRHSKATIDYFLAHIIFTKEMKEFPSRLSASGWDIGEVKNHPTTGFSGTNDAKVVLPLDIKQEPLPEQAHTNALVLQYLLQSENSVALVPSMPRDEHSSSSTESLKTNADQLLDMVVAMNPPVRVILDVGAQIIELDNLGVARKWLSLLRDDDTTEAAVFVDGQDNICVVDRKGRIEPLFSSPYLTQLKLCVIFLDDAHTRGTDLKLPEDYRAAVTLGANLTKDRTVQACMRMRKLGHGQSVVFCVSEEIERKILAVKASSSKSTEIEVVDVLAWVISETWQDARRNTSLWAMQGGRHERHHKLWSKARGATGFSFSETLGRDFLEDEAELIETRYRPKGTSTSEDAAPVSQTQSSIRERCRNIDSLGLASATLQEEQERELAPEVEEERQLERPPKAEPLEHKIDPDVCHFIQTGVLSKANRAFIPVYQSLLDSSAKGYVQKLQGRRTLVYCTRDFQSTIQRPRLNYISDSFQRPVQWVLTSAVRNGEGQKRLKYMVIISPYEAQHLMSQIEKSTCVTLHLYAPLMNPSFRSLDKLDLYPIPQQAVPVQVPQDVTIELNLFSGQLYFKNLDEFEALRNYLQDPASTAHGAKPRLDENLVSMLNIVMMKIRRNCETIDKTHTGKALDCRVLEEADFEE